MQFVEQPGLSWTAVNTPLRLHGKGSAATLKPGIRGMTLTQFPYELKVRNRGSRPAAGWV
jgi:hypothetical protein